MNLPWIESPFFDEIVDSQQLSEDQRKLAREYNKNGFIVVKDAFSDDLLEEVKSEMHTKGFNPDFKTDIPRNEQRVQDLWMHSDPVKQVASSPVIIDTLKMLYGRDAIPFQTLNFPVGSQQRAHSDTIHFSSLPARFMCGVWVALEDISEEQGPVFYYPGSHKLPEYDFSHFKVSVEDTNYYDYPSYEDFIEKIVTTSGYPKKLFEAKKGDALIWSSNIIHGGSPVLKEKSTRYSQVTHYYFKDCIYYTPMLSNMVTNELFLRHDVKDIRTGEVVPQSFNGIELNHVQTGSSKFILNNRLKGIEKKGILERFGLKF